MTLEARIRKKGRQLLDEMGQTQYHDPIVSVMSFGAPISALITLNDRKIYIATTELFDYLVADITHDEQLRRGDRRINAGEFFDSLMYAVIGHEFDHHWECPRNQELFQLIIQGAYDFLHGRERSERDTIDKCLTVANFFEDTILNTINALTDRDKNRYKEGLAHIFLMNYYFMRGMGTRYIDKGSSIMVGTELALCQIEPTLRKKVENYFTPRIITHNRLKFLPVGTFFEFERYRQKLITVFTGNDLYTQQVLDGTLPPGDQQRLVNRLRDTSLWKQMSYDYTSAIYPFIKEPDEAYQNSFTRSPSSRQNQRPQKGNSGQQKQSSDGKNSPQQRDDSNQQGKDNGSGTQGDKDNGGGKHDEKEAQPQIGKGKKNKEKKGKGKKEQSHPSENDERSGDEEMYVLIPSSGQPDKKHFEVPKWYQDLQRQENDRFYPIIKEMLKDEKDEDSPHVLVLPRMDMLYRRRAGRIKIIGEEEKDQGDLEEHMLSTEEMPFDEFSSEHIDWSQTRVFTKDSGKKEVKLYRKTNPLTLPIEGGGIKGGLPDIAWVVDCSPSMYFDPEKGEGEYHIAALTIYSMLNYLEQEGIAPLLNYNMMTFSNKTRSSGWCTYSEQMQFKRTLFNKTGSATVLDPYEFSRLRRERHDNFILFMLSDFAFNFETNQQEVLYEIDQMLQTRGIGIFPFQIGTFHTTFSLAMQDRGIQVPLISKVEDFLTGSIKITKDLYAEATA